MQQILMKLTIRTILASVMAITAAACGTRETEAGFVMEDTGWPAECSEGYSKGVSAPFCTVFEGRPLIAGGANFPDVPAADGGTKRFYSDIQVLGDDGWYRAGELPFPLAYGGCVCADGQTVLAGGSNSSGTVADVFQLVPLGDGVVALPMTPLPYPVEQAGYAADGSVVYVAGGITPDGVNMKVLAGKIRGLDVEWEEMAPMPEPLVQPVAFITGGHLHVWGGFDPQAKTVSSKGWKMDLETRRWEEAGEGPDGETFAGAAAVVLADGKAVAAGGVDKDVFSWGLSGKDKDRYMRMAPEEYGFNRRLRIYDPDKGVWSSAGESEAFALAGAGMTTDGSSIYIIGGEIKPGIRTPQTWKTELTIK